MTGPDPLHREAERLLRLATTLVLNRAAAYLRGMGSEYAIAVEQLETWAEQGVLTRPVDPHRRIDYPDDQRDYAEEDYWRGRCGNCDSKPCQCAPDGAVADCGRRYLRAGQDRLCIRPAGHTGGHQ